MKIILRRLGLVCSSLVWAVSLLFLFSGCKKDLAESTTPDPDLEKSIEGRSNPFSVENVNKALANLRAKSPNARMAGTAAVVGATHRYVKFKPLSPDQMADLDQAGLELENEPMDENAVTNRVPINPSKPITNRIPEEGDFTQIPELYSVIPINYPLPTNVPVTVIQDLVLFDTDSGDENDDEWIPDPPPTCNSIVPDKLRQTPTTNYIKPCPGGRVEKVNQIALMNQKLKEEGIDPVDLYNEAMRISGNEDETMEKGKTSGARRYYPSGTLTVRETALGTNVPLKGVRVKARRWFKLDNTYTDVNGRFSISKGFRKKATLIVIFKNNSATVRGITGALKVWEYALPLSYQIGRYTQSEMEGLSYNFSYVSDARSKGAAIFVACTFMNSIWDMYTIHARNNNIALPPADLNVWVSSAVTQAASTPMLRRMTTVVALPAINWHLENIPGADLIVAKKTLQRALPDITCRYESATGTTRGSDDLTNTFFHELSHSMHYSQVGNEFWLVYIGYILANKGYGNKSSGGSERIAVSEGWAFYAGNTFTAVRYDGTSARDVSFRNRQELENQRPADDRWENWIVFGMYHDMTDTGEPTTTGVVDNVNNGFSTGQLFWALRPNVKTVRDYREQIRTYYNTIQPTQVDQLVTSYRY